MSKWRPTIAAVSLIALGAVSGILIDRHLPSADERRAAHMMEVQRDPVAALGRTVKLRPEQRERVAAIFARRQVMVDTVWLSARSSLQASVDSMVDEIAAVLDPDQAATFRASAAKLHATPLIIHRRTHRP